MTYVQHAMMFNHVKGPSVFYRIKIEGQRFIFDGSTLAVKNNRKITFKEQKLMLLK